MAEDAKELPDASRGLGTSEVEQRLLALDFEHLRARDAKAEAELTDMEVSTTGHAQFRRTSVDHDGNVIDLTGYLEMLETSRTWLIASDGDTATDANPARAKASRCEAAVDGIVYATADA